jgi:rSAM/selenodomain-associated transferase 1
MLKAPRPGTVKTRLAAAIGDAEATRVYRLLAERQLAAIPPDWPVEVHFSPADARDEMRAWLGPRPTLLAQSEGDLGARLIHATTDAFTRGAPAALVIGGDCPELDTATLHAAVEALRQAPLVLGPATDGGYYLIGFTEPRPALFADIPWSTERVLAATLHQAASLNISATQLAQKGDVDTLEDLRCHAHFLSRDGQAAFSWPD